METHSTFDPVLFGDFRGSHIIRDPRDVVLSGYHYHMTAAETWLHDPRPEYDGLSYQKYLNSLDRYEGLTTEMQWCKNRTVRDMLEWNYDDERFMEMKYEDAMQKPGVVFKNLFAHYGLSSEQIAIAVDIAMEHTLTASRRTGVSEHIRDGRVEQWRDDYDSRLRDAYSEILGDAHIQLGYDDW